jgi:hypothetical protein
LFPQCSCPTATWQRPLKKIDVSGVIVINRYPQLYSAVENLASEHYDPAPGFPARPFNFRSGIKVALGGEVQR